MHGQLYQKQDRLTAEELPRYANAIGLDISSFQECLNGGSHQTEIGDSVQEDLKLGVQGTPTFFLGVQEFDGSSIIVVRTIVGAVPYPVFKAAVETALQQIGH